MDELAGPTLRGAACPSEPEPRAPGGDHGVMPDFPTYQEPDDQYLFATERELRPQPIRRALVVLVSDHTIRSGPDTDRLVTELLTETGFHVDGVVSVKSCRSDVRKAIETAVVGGIDLVVTVGGTGVSPRDHTPEATRMVLDKLVPGIAQAVRASGLACHVLDAATSRGISGVSGSTVIVNLAASRAAIRDGVATLSPLVHHIIDGLQRYETHDRSHG